ncbi:MAG: hypothetical protein ACP5K1_05745 [Candidatus Bathyarchaeia archaeon]
MKRERELNKSSKMTGSRHGIIAEAYTEGLQDLSLRPVAMLWIRTLA